MENRSIRETGLNDAPENSVDKFQVIEKVEFQFKNLMQTDW